MGAKQFQQKQIPPGFGQNPAVLRALQINAQSPGWNYTELPGFQEAVDRLPQYPGGPKKDEANATDNSKGEFDEKDWWHWGR
jgi:hypothetical protein